MNFNFIFNKHFLFVFLILVSCIVLFHRLDEAPLSGDGIGYAQIAKEMSITQDYLTPYHDGEAIFYTSKPPLLYWLMLCSGKILGFNNFSVKFPIAFLAFLSIIIMFLFVSKYYNYTIAFFTSIILLFTQQYLFHARCCVTDGPLAVFFMIALISFWIATNDDKPMYYYSMSLFIALAIMTKQISGLLIYFVIFGYFVLSKDIKALKNIHFYISFLFIPLIVLPWHIAMYNKFGNTFIKEYFCSTINNIQGWNISGPSNENYNISLSKYNFFHEWYIYLQILINNYWPWLPFLFYSFYKKFKNIKYILLDKNKKEIFVLCWALIPFIILQFVSRKINNYILPLYPVFALICAEVLFSFSKDIVQKIIKILICISILSSILFISFPIISKTLDSQKLVDPIKLIPNINLIDKSEKIIIRKKDNFVFSSMFLFYADRGNITLNDNDFENKILEQKKNYFASYKDDFIKNILKKYENKLNLLCETKQTVLFTN